MVLAVSYLCFFFKFQSFRRIFQILNCKCRAIFCQLSFVNVILLKCMGNVMAEIPKEKWLREHVKVSSEISHLFQP